LRSPREVTRHGAIFVRGVGEDVVEVGAAVGEGRLRRPRVQRCTPPILAHVLAEACKP